MPGRDALHPQTSASAVCQEFFVFPPTSRQESPRRTCSSRGKLCLRSTILLHTRRTAQPHQHRLPDALDWAVHHLTPTISVALQA